MGQPQSAGRWQRRCALVLGIMMCAWLVACQPAAEAPAPTVEPFVPAAPTVESAAPATPLIRTEPPPDAVFPTPSPPDPIQVAINVLADDLNVMPADITFVAATPVEWDDSSLGCPQPGRVYLPVITSGYLVRLTHGDEQYEIHTDLAGTAIVCTGGEGLAATSGVRDPIVAEFIASARRSLAAELGVAAEDVALVRSEAVEWRSSALGCEPPPEEEVVQAVTTGYRIVLAVGDERYEFHTDQQRLVRCETPTE